MAAALNRFISRSVDRCRPFFLLINKWKNFEWTEECAKAFQQLKDYLARPLIMSSPEPDEVLFAYIAVAPYAVSLMLIRVDNGIQRPVYYVSKSLHETEVCYLPLEKAILAVVHGTRKLPHYFQHIQWSFLHSSHSKPYSEVPTTQEELPNEIQFWGLSISSTCPVPP